jgi:4-hydroxybenzoate polyprenyltransferase
MSDYAKPFTLRPYLELVRLPNLFTAAADATMGLLFTHSFAAFDEPQMRLLAGLLVGASVALYAGGVALNDVFDADLDARERPERPIPSGRVSLTLAKGLGWGLLALGVALACVAATIKADARPAVVAILLAALILLYDRVLKRTPLGPIGMGGCRMLNVLLGMSIAPTAWRLDHGLVAAALGVYIAGVTWLARSEARESSRRQLALATLVILGGMALLALVPEITDRSLPISAERWYLLFAVLGGLTAVRCVRPILSPDPRTVQMAVMHCIHAIVIFDALACFMGRGPNGALLVFLFLPLTIMTGRWIRST